MINRVASISLIVIIAGACVSIPKGTYTPIKEITTVDYEKLENWAAHPQKEDPSDLIPADIEGQHQTPMPVDIFFIHPTIYIGKRGEKNWNAAIKDEKLNNRVDESTIHYQASIFNQTGRIFAPRYRQAHLHSFYTKDTSSAKKALDFAYLDVKQAFNHYWNNHNQGRPLIIASHSQGAYHASRLLKEYFDGTTDQNKLIAAYLVGFPINKK